MTACTPSFANPSRHRACRPPEEKIVEMREYYERIQSLGDKQYRNVNMRTVVRTAKNGEEKTYRCLREAAHDMGCSTTTIHFACERKREYAGYKWRKL